MFRERTYPRITRRVILSFLTLSIFFFLHQNLNRIQQVLGRSQLGLSISTQNPNLGSLWSEYTPYCKWQFQKYESSSYEEKWFSNVPHVQSSTKEGSNICKAMLLPEHRIASEQIIRRVNNLTSIDPQIQWSMYDTMPTTVLTAADNYMSRMHYSRVCYNDQAQEFEPAPGHGIQLIEPLFGMLRDPFDKFCGPDKLKMEDYINETPGQSKAHIMTQGFAPYGYTTTEGEVTEWRTHGIPPWHSSLRPIRVDLTVTSFRIPQNIHLDLGSSYFDGWTVMNKNPKNGKKKQAASGKWFYETYHKRGQKFDRFIGVEVEVLNATTAYNQIPDDLIGVYSLMNTPLSMGADKLNVVDMIKRIVNPEDFFVLKLDIDNAPIEEPLVQDLLNDDPKNGGASALIDEMMFEHHVNFYPMNSPWRGKLKKDKDLLYSYNLFRNLRRKGIRSHSWP